MKKNIGVYRIYNTQNGKAYIGQSVDIDKRLKHHLYLLKRNIHKNSYLQFAWNKYTEKFFKFEILEICEEENMDKLEVAFIIEARKNDKCYNFESGGKKINGIIRIQKIRLAIL